MSGEVAKAGISSEDDVGAFVLRTDDQVVHPSPFHHRLRLPNSRRIAGHPSRSRTWLPSPPFAGSRPRQLDLRGNGDANAVSNGAAARPIAKRRQSAG
jgi:hypothetical protein